MSVEETPALCRPNAIKTPFIFKFTVNVFHFIKQTAGSVQCTCSNKHFIIFELKERVMSLLIKSPRFHSKIFPCEFSSNQKPIKLASFPVKLVKHLYLIISNSKLFVSCDVNHIVFTGFVFVRRSMQTQMLHSRTKI